MGEKIRSRGRPRTGDEAQFDHEELERLLVHGEFSTPDDGPARHRYPSFAELGSRFGLSKTAVHRFARRHNCLERRAGSGADDRPDEARGDDERDEPLGELMLPTVREIFVTWVRAVQRGDVRIASAGEIEKMMRIAADLDADQQMRALVPEGVPTLAELQELHMRRLREFEESTPGERGLIPIVMGDAMHTEPELREGVSEVAPE